MGVAPQWDVVVNEGNVADIWGTSDMSIRPRSPAVNHVNQRRGGKTKQGGRKAGGDFGAWGYNVFGPAPKSVK